jgi:hypothetical protein
VLKRLSKRIERNKYAQSKIFSAAITAGILLMYMFTLDIFAVYTLKNKPAILRSRNIDENVLPYTVLGYDSFLVLVWLVCYTISCCIVFSTREGKDHGDKESNEYIFIAASTVSPALVFVVHVPYVAIAYLNDVSHATSMFIYYTVVAFVLFGTLDLSHGAYVRTLLRLKERQGDRGNKLDKSQGCPRDEENIIHRHATWGILLFTILTLIMIGMITAALVTVPISKAFTDTSNRLLGFYQTALVLIGAYLFYRNVFKKNTTLESEVHNRAKDIKREGDDDYWQTLSKDQKLAKVYSHVLDILADYPFKTTQHGASKSLAKEESSKSKENSESESNSTPDPAVKSKKPNLRLAQLGDSIESDPSQIQLEEVKVKAEVHEVYISDDKSHPKGQENETTPLLKNTNV